MRSVCIYLHHSVYMCMCVEYVSHICSSLSLSESIYDYPIYIYIYILACLILSCLCAYLYNHQCLIQILSIYPYDSICGLHISFFGLYFYGVFTYFLLIYAYLSLYICYSPMRLHTHTRIYIYHMLMKNLMNMEMHVVLRCLLVTRWSHQKTLQSEWSWGRVLDLPSILIPYRKPFWDLKIFTQKSAIKQLPSQTNCVAAQGRAARRLNIHVVQPSTDKAQENEKSANPDPAHQPQHQASHYCFPRAKTTGWVSLSITPSRPKRKSS